MKKNQQEQVGFLKGYSIIDHIFTLISFVKKKLEKAEEVAIKVFVAFIDCKKAFDTVDQDKWWEKLKKL